MSESREAPRNFCQQPSNRYLTLLDECGDDPRSVAGWDALYQLKTTGAPANPIDARESSGLETFTADTLSDLIRDL
jgi:hypothetical protein